MKVYTFNESETLNELSVSGDWGYNTPRAWIGDKKHQKHFLDVVLKVYKGYNFAKRDDLNFKPIWGNNFTNDINNLLTEDEEYKNYDNTIRMINYVKKLISYKMYEYFKQRSYGNEK